jgi:1,2-dihydroxy-3-keto-5-methylthiopentene dioxygenase
MSRLTIYADNAPDAPRLRTEDQAEIAAELGRIGVRFERWESPVRLAPDAGADAILAAYRPYLDALMGATGAGSADVVSMSPQTPNLPAIRAKFLAEHTHSEDEIRFFVRGSGNFVLHVNGEVWDARCGEGDLISVPANVKHWFDAGLAPSFTCLRVFTDSTGWVPHYTGDAIAERFPVS